ncbi:MAG: hypothetical protein H8E97_08280, partial [Bacteroidetes bacterium]|nr:hypothetical protein [Bacteroidota bacterium]
MKNLINILDRIGTIIPGCCMTYLYNQIFKLGKHLCYLFIVIYSFIPSAAEGQDILLAFKQIEKNNYEKALEILDVDKNVKASSKIDECVNNNTMEIVLFLKEYGLSRIFASQQYSGYSLEESYKHIDSEYYRLFLDKEKNYECLQKQDITLEECQKHKSDVDDRLFDLYNDDIDSLNEFIIRFTSSKHINTAIEIRNKLAYEYFSQKGTLSDFEEFIKLYPNASQVAQAKEMITAIEFETICKINSVKAYNDFL